MKKLIKTISIAVFAVVAMWSCKGSKYVAYFQDVANKDTVLQMAQVQPLRIMNGDKLLIVVYSRDMDMARIYNLPIPGTRIGISNTATSPQATMAYTVDTNGCIDFPVLGRLSVAGMRRDEVATMIKDRLVNENLLNDAVVTVEMDNLYVNIIGEVSKPGRYSLTKDNMTVIDALGMASDLGIQGQRTNVLVVRNIDNQAHTYCLDLNNLEQVVKSPAYYLQQNDIVYVEPNNYRKRQTTVNGNNALSTSFWVSVASLITSIISIATR